MDSKDQIWIVKMVVDDWSLESMNFIAKSMGVTIEVLASQGESYSYRGGIGSSLVPDNHKYILINPGTHKIGDFWTKVMVEKTKRRLVLEAAALKELSAQQASVV